jgi:aminopeptidase N
MTAYRRAAGNDAPSTPTFRYWPATAGAISYGKTALWLHTLENWLGWPVLQRGMSVYFAQWKFRHPQPTDFFQALAAAAGRDLTPFFDEVYRGSNTFDYGVQQLTSTPAGRGRFRTTVVARRFGEAVFPIEVVTTFNDGSTRVEHWNGVERRMIYRYDSAVRAKSVQVDPNRVLMLDTDYTNNSRTLQPRAREASIKWGLKWMAWLQELLITYGSLV